MAHVHGKECILINPSSVHKLDAQFQFSPSCRCRRKRSSSSRIRCKYAPMIVCVCVMITSANMTRWEARILSAPCRQPMEGTQLKFKETYRYQTKCEEEPAYHTVATTLRQYSNEFLVYLPTVDFLLAYRRFHMFVI